MLVYINKLFNSKFFKNSILYTVGSMMTSIIGLLMLPIYTDYLSPAEYGIMTTVLTIMGMLQLFLILSLHGAITRFYYDFLDQPEKQREYLGSIFLFVLIFSTTVSIFLWISNDFFGQLLFKNIPITPFYFYLIILSWLTSLLELPMALFRAMEMAKLYAVVNLIKALLIMGTTVYLLVVKNLGVESVFISQIIITLIILLFTFFLQINSLKFSMNLSHIKNSLIFSLPLLPHFASAWIISSSDRVILEKYVSMNDLGLYALAAQVTYVLNVFYSSVNNAFVPRYTMLRQEGNEKHANKLLKILTVIVLVSGILSIPIAVYGVKIFISTEYLGALSLIPFLLVGKITTGLYLIPVAKLYYAKKTKAIAKSSSIAALINVILNFIAIPFIGIYGAVFSTIISELFRYVFINSASKKTFNL